MEKSDEENGKLITENMTSQHRIIKSALRGEWIVFVIIRTYEDKWINKYIPKWMSAGTVDGKII